eukprot:CAMPEP_0198735112 /NCGR_PEP_ID=MMETSP1475-20131203/57354_1 /TAXON_ID= ORGANISM="Unidentified sp., Strain CCMP1999" /NCGR_SAMPLE_ID=MMETSP1475 /ASSEMBLY_ACC=CAM_ASM_001111 /LENGTH=47 /DNA_ID= /DNA_START= /DNA_END= /DNA_ORIENTATION=
MTASPTAAVNEGPARQPGSTALVHSSKARPLSSKIVKTRSVVDDDAF